MTSSRALVSVVLPTCNRAEFLGGAIETALGQTHERIEIVVVDGGSTDGTAEILERYADDERVSVVGTAPETGIAHARNRGLARARGEFICPLDDDDRWHPEKIARQLAVFERYGEDVGVVYSGGIARRNGRVVRTYRPRDDRQGEVYPAILADFGLNPYAGHMIRRECFERVGGYDTRFPHGEDWEHCIRLAREYEFAALSEPLVTRHLHDGNRSQQFRDTAAMDLVWETYSEAIERHPEIRRRFLTRWYRRRSRAHAERGERSAALSLGVRAAIRAPSTNALGVVAAACLGRRGLIAVRDLRTRLDRHLPGEKAPPTAEPTARGTTGTAVGPAYRETS